MVKPLHLVRAYEKLNVGEQEIESPTCRTHQRLIEASFFSVFVSMTLGTLSETIPLFTNKIEKTNRVKCKILKFSLAVFRLTVWGVGVREKL